MLKWLRHLLLVWLNPCKDCAYNMDRDEVEANPYNWGNGQPIETSTNNVYYEGDKKCKSY